MAPSEFAELQTRAAAAEEEGDFRVAAGLFRRLVDIAPHRFEVHANLGTALAQQGLVGEALRELEFATSLAPDRWEPFYAYGRVLLTTNRTDEAIRAFHVAARIKPGDVGILYLLGCSYVQRDRFREAVECLQQAVTLKDDSAAVYGALGWSLFYSNDLEAAAEAFQQMAALEPHNAHPHFGLGDTLSKAGRFDEAIEAYTKSLRLNPSEFHTNYNLAVAHFKAGNAAAAASTMEAAIRLDETSVDAYLTAGRFYFHDFYFELALARFEKALHLAPNDYRGHLYRGNALCNLCRYADAAKEYQTTINLEPGIVAATEAYEKFGLTCLGMEDLSSALAAFDKAIRLNRDISPSPPDADVHGGSRYIFNQSRVRLYRGLTLWAFGHDLEAFEEIDRAIAADPTFARAYRYRDYLLSLREDHNTPKRSSLCEDLARERIADEHEIGFKYSGRLSKKP